MSSPYEPNTSQASWRNSFSSLFRISSPERGSRASIHVASVARFSPAGPGATLRGDSSTPSSTSPRLINISDFADSSLSESDQLHDSENIFLVIEEYVREPTCHFTEEMAGAVAAMVESKARPHSGDSLSSGALLDHLDDTHSHTFGSSGSGHTPQLHGQSTPPRCSGQSTPPNHGQGAPGYAHPSQSQSISPAPQLRPPALDSSSLCADLLGVLSASAPRVPAPVYVASEPAREWAPLPENTPLARSYTRDSRTSDGLGMFSGGQDYSKVGTAAGSKLDLEKNTPEVPVLWARWTMVLVCGLVALPIFFLVAFGTFDRGGYTERPRGAGLGRAYYTRPQRMLSFALGLVWLATVFAMVGLGFGLTVRRHL